MLIRFNVKNFLSFSHGTDIETKEEKSQEFSMIPGKMRSKYDHIYSNDKQDLLKFAVIYGANASGKSNLVKAISFMQAVVISGKLPVGSAEKYCKSDSKNKTLPSYFEIEILLDNQCFSYGFEVILSTGTIISEWLYEVSQKEKLLFTRDTKLGNYEFGQSLQEMQNLEIYASDIKNDSEILFLSLMNQNKTSFYEENKEATVLQKIYSWIESSLDINPFSDCSYLTDTINIPKLPAVMYAFDTGITAIRNVETSLARILADFPPQKRKSIETNIEMLKENTSNKSETLLIRSREKIYTIQVHSCGSISAKTMQFIHQNKNILFDLEEESDGTARLFDLIEILISNTRKTYIIDGLNRFLHPSLTYEFVKTFFTLAKERNTQLIVTSHESRLLDFDLLRRDEIWFINKNSASESDMYSLEEYNERFDKKIDKAYLEGRYGGVPVFSSLFPINEDQEIQCCKTGNASEV